MSVIEEIRAEHILDEDSNLTYQDVAVALTIVKNLNPDHFMSPTAKETILKVKRHFKLS